MIEPAYGRRVPHLGAAQLARLKGGPWNTWSACWGFCFGGGGGQAQNATKELILSRLELQSKLQPQSTPNSPKATWLSLTHLAAVGLAIAQQAPPLRQLALDEAALLLLGACSGLV